MQVYLLELAEIMPIFLNMSRDCVKTFEYHDSWVLISINEPDVQPPGIICTNMVDRTVLNFHDIDSAEENCVLFSEENAIQILDFVKKHTNIHLVVIHCYAGISRSAAVAAALHTSINNCSDSHYWKRFIPNKHVYSTIMKVINEQK